MLSLSSMKDGTIVPSEDDRKKILTQMKVKTTLRSDKSWIQKKSDSGEEERNHSPLHSPLRNRKASERSPVSPKVSPLNHRAVFEELASQAEQPFPVSNKPSKKSHNTSSSSGYLIRGVFTKTVDKNIPSNTVSNGTQKSAKNANSAPGYRMSTEDYKKLAPYNVKRDTVPEYVEHPVSPDEQLKRTEAASSVLRQTARKERSYVLSAAKKSNGVEIEDDTGPRSRSQTMPASSWINSRGKSPVGERRNLWGDQKMSNAASTTSIDMGSRNQASKHSSGYSSAFSHFTSLENSNKQDQEKYHQTSRDESPSKGPLSSPKKSWEGRKAQDATMNQNSQVPPISSESSPKRSSFRYQTGDADAVLETHHQSETKEYLNDNGADSERYAADQEEGTFYKEVKYGSLSPRITEDQPATAQSLSLAGDSTDPTAIRNDQETDPKRSLSSLEEKTAQEETDKSQSETEYKKVETHLAQTNALSTESNVAATPENHQGEHGSDLNASSLSRRVTLGSSGNIYGMATNPDNLVCNHSVWESGPRTSSYLNRQVSYPCRTSCGNPSCLSSQPYNPSMPEMTHTMTPFLNNSTFSSGRSFSTSRENLVTNPPRSHRMPFYKDMCDAESRRFLSQTEDRAAFTPNFTTTPSQFRNPTASGYDSDPSTSGKTFLFVKESINSTELSSSPRHNSRSLVDLSTLERQNYSCGTFLQCTPPMRPSDDICTYCGREIRNCPKIKIEKLNICCHEFCFRCGICHKPMGDLLDKIFIHRDIVHCDKCYEKLF